MKRVGRSVPVASAWISAGAKGPWLTSHAASGRSTGGSRKTARLIWWKRRGWRLPTTSNRPTRTAPSRASPGVEGAGLAPAHPLDPPHSDGAIQVVPGGEGRRPGRLVARRGRPDLDVPSPKLEGVGQPPDQLLAPPADVRAVAGHHQAEPAPAPWGPVGRREHRLAAVVGGVGHTPTADPRSARYQSARVSGSPDSPASPCRTARIWWMAIDPCSKPTRLPLMYSFQTRARWTPTRATASSHPASSRSTQLRRVR